MKGKKTLVKYGKKTKKPKKKIKLERKSNMILKNLDMTNMVKSLSHTDSVFPYGTYARKKPLIYKLIGWLFDKRPDVKKMFLIDFINETNGRVVIKTEFSKYDGQEITLESNGMVFSDLTLERKKT